MKNPLIGKWIENEDMPYPGLCFVFNEDGTFDATYDAMAIVSGGTWSAEGNQIDMDQTHHTFELLGKFVGLFEIEGDQLKMALVTESNERPETLELATHYTRG